ncbi:MAG TPA: Mrp/NBP35 family ATP-binding protein [Roseiflexaceae bacterium]|nr:Mrp/NBP35 family ATP-binding protein [Roseiflexaceae bacterium]
MTADLGPDREQVLAALRRVLYPGRSRDIVSFGLVPHVAACDGLVKLTLAIAHLDDERQHTIMAASQEVVRAMPGVRDVSCELTTPGAAARRPAARGTLPERHRIPGVTRVLAVGSGKGGVGKTTVSVNLAVALARLGRRVGLLDADIYGPNVPRMLGVTSLPAPQGQRLVPAEGWGVRVMSLALIAQHDQAVVWRGPMIGKMLAQFLDQVAWGTLDDLIVDLPPGTGDAPLSLAQRIALDGAIVVSTPQDVALDDALRGVAMFQKLGVPILGMVENMSTFVCPCCGHAEPIFGSGGAAQAAERLGVALLATLPIIPAIRAGGDGGHPPAAEQGTPQAAAFEHLAAAVLEQVAQRAQASHAELQR